MTELGKHELEYLRESEALAGNPAFAVEEVAAESHATALRELLEMTPRRVPLSVAHLHRWQQWCGDAALEGQVSDDELRSVSHQVNGPTASIYKFDVGQICMAIADGMFSAHSVLGAERGRVVRLAANYAALRLNRPLIIFPAAAKEAYTTALLHPLETRLFVAEVLREAIYGPDGSVFSRQGSSGLYRNPEGSTLIVEWHQLDDAIEAWKHELSSNASQDAQGSR